MMLRMAEALHGHIALMREEGLPIPEPTTEAERISG
jgi:predicted RNase H-like HicB family nuclease